MMRKRRSGQQTLLSVKAVSDDQIRSVIVYGCLMTVYAKARQRLEVAAAAATDDAGDVRLAPLIDAATADAGVSGLVPNVSMMTELETAAASLHTDISDARERQIAACRTVIDKLAAAAMTDGIDAMCSAAASAVIRDGVA